MLDLVELNREVNNHNSGSIPAKEYRDYRRAGQRLIAFAKHLNEGIYGNTHPEQFAVWDETEHSWGFEFPQEFLRFIDLSQAEKQYGDMEGPMVHRFMLTTRHPQSPNQELLNFVTVFISASPELPEAKLTWLEGHAQLPTADEDLSETF